MIFGGIHYSCISVQLPDAVRSFIGSLISLDTRTGSMSARLIDNQLQLFPIWLEKRGGGGAAESHFAADKLV